MTEHFKDIKQHLLARKIELEERLKGLAAEKVTDDEVHDPADQASAATSEEISLSIQKNEYDEYLMICKALDALDKGTYGICIDCGQPISPRRLALYPNATRCVACQEQAES
jgi:DnaK suppressor protein